MSKEFTTVKTDDVDAYVCSCGNDSGSDGFFPCDEQGEEMEPLVGSNWDGLYVCARCGKIHKVID